MYNNVYRVGKGSCSHIAIYTNHCYYFVPKASRKSTMSLQGSYVSHGFFVRHIWPTRQVPKEERIRKWSSLTASSSVLCRQTVSFISTRTCTTHHLRNDYLILTWNVSLPLGYENEAEYLDLQYLRQYSIHIHTLMLTLHSLLRFVIKLVPFHLNMRRVKHHWGTPLSETS